MTREREELLNDPAARLLLFKAGEARNVHLRKLSDHVGVKFHRLKRRGVELDEHGFITVDKGVYVDVRSRNVDSLKRFRKGIEKFADKRKETLIKRTEQASENLNSVLGQMKEQRNETESVTREKKLSAKIQHVNGVLRTEKDFASPETVLCTASVFLKAERRFCDVKSIHGCNVERKARTLSGLNSILEGRLVEQ